MSKALRLAPIIIAVVLGASAASFAAESRAGLVPTHREVEPIGTAPQAKFENLVTFCMDGDGNLLACDAGASRIVKLDPEGKTLATCKLDFAPWAIHACPEGVVYVAGRLAASCSNITLAVNKDASHIYVLDFKNNIIRVLARSVGPDARSAAR